MRETLERERLVAAYRRRKPESSGYYSFGAPGYVLEAQERERLALRALQRERAWPLGGLRILDVGCGNGRWLRDLVRWGAEPANVVGIDALDDRVARARQLVPPSLAVHGGDAAKLPFEDASFDLVVQCMLMSSVLDPGARRSIAGEMLRVLKPGGVILWQDFAINNPRNADVRAVTRRELRVLFPGCRARLRRAFPPTQIVRLLAPLSWSAAALVFRLRPLGASHFGVIRRPS